MSNYDSKSTEAKWQARWKEMRLHKPEATDKPKYYNLTMFPYPSGDRLHVGHWYNYAPVDSWGRYMRMKGYNVFQPMGFDSFGLPAENYAIKTGVHPAETTRANIDKMKQQIEAIGGLYDLELNLETSSPEYYKWTQWIFLQLYKNDLAYRKEAPVNWCKSCQTVLANEQVVEGRCERCKNDVIQKNLTQWFFKITAHADRLLDHSGLDWPEKTKLMQTNWIGKSEGAEIDFKVGEHSLRVYTTRPDTLFGATYMVLSPEHPLLEDIVTPEQASAVEAYQKKAKSKSELERTELNKERKGVFTGAMAMHPITGKEVPVWIADYVLMTYGTGAIMAVPAHDERDHEFARNHDLPILPVIEAPEGHDLEAEAYTGDGKHINSDFLDGLNVADAKSKMIDWLESKKKGSRQINYRLRDWLVSRQRYWGAPIPIIYCESCGEVPVPEADLPVVHPHVEDYVPKGKSPLATVEDFVNTTCPSCQGPATREVDTMDTFVCSSWYFLRYPDALNSEKAWEKAKTDAWMPVDMYIGGPEHACMHLLYARFIHQAMHDLGHVSTKEPFKRLVHQGMVTKDGAKMSKSKGNVVSPDDFVGQYGSDVFRMYLMFMGPFEQGGDWNDQGILGVARFVDRFWRMMQSEHGEGKAMQSPVHKTIERVTDALERMNFNVAVAALMELTNEGLKTPLNQEQKELTLQLIAPLAPHLAEELWEHLGHTESIFITDWPSANPDFLVEDQVTYAIQVNGKLRATLDLPKDTSKEEALAAARAVPKVAEYLEGGELKKEIFVPGKIIGFVVA